MRDRDVRRLRDLIWYQYAKIIAKRALWIEDLFVEKAAIPKKGPRNAI